MKSVSIATRHQQGSTLIIVLIILLMLTIVGVFSIRTATTTLNISTNAQTSQLLGQTADTPINALQNQGVSSIRNLGSVIGYAIEDSKTEPGKEYIFCYRPTSSSRRVGNSIDMVVARVGTDGGLTVADGTVNAFCDLDADYGSGRDAVVTQIAVKIPTDALDTSETGTDEVCATCTQGNDLSNGKNVKTSSVSQRIRVTTTAIFPFFAADEDVAQACVRERLNDNSDTTTRNMTTVAQCLANLGVPVSSQMQEFYLQDISELIEEI